MAENSSYNPEEVKKNYNQVVDREDRDEKKKSLRTEIPREFIKKYLKEDDMVLDAGGGTGINAIMMAKRCEKVTLLDISEKILDRAQENIKKTDVEDKIELFLRDITDLNQFEDEEFSFTVCVGDSISYVRDKRGEAMKELVRVTEEGSYLFIGCDGKYGVMRKRLKEEGDLEKALKIMETNEARCGMGPMTQVYSVEEMKKLIRENGCEVLEIASTPSISDLLDREVVKKFKEEGKWKKLKDLELELCTKREIHGMGHHLLFVAKKEQ